MSDQTNPSGAGDFRGSAADKRKDETVMVNADDLSNLVANARQEPVAPAPASAPVAPVAAPAAGGNRTVVIAVVVVLILVLVALVAFIAFS